MNAIVSPGTSPLDPCGDGGPQPPAANDQRSYEIVRVLPHMLSIGLRKLAENPAERDAAVRIILRNAVRLAEIQLGRQEAAAIAIETLRETDR